METRIYQKKTTKSPLTLLGESIRDLKSSLFLSRQLAKRDIKSQYRQSFFGIIWAFITPITTAIVWVILHRTGTIKLSDTGIPYPLYAFSGTLIWSIITESINTPMSSLRAARGIISKINFPKEALVLSGIYKMLFNTSIKMLLLAFFLIYFKVAPSSTVFLFPFILFGIIIFGITIGLFITPFGILYNDVSKIISIGLRFLMYATPVVYAIPKDGVMKNIMELNPITSLVITSRNALVGLPLDNGFNFLMIIGISMFLFCLGLIFYRVSVPILVERFGS